MNEKRMSNNDYTKPRRGLFLNYQDFKKLERIIEDYNFNSELKEVDFDHMELDEKEVLWKIKTIIQNIESARLRPNNGDQS